jgi:hypothetical protein
MRRAVDHSYLLRLWADHSDDPLRATLVPVGTHDVRYHFASLDELMAFLAAVAQGSPLTGSGDRSDTGTTYEGGP